MVLQVLALQVVLELPDLLLQELDVAVLVGDLGFEVALLLRIEELQVVEPELLLVGVLLVLLMQLGDFRLLVAQTFLQLRYRHLQVASDSLIHSGELSAGVLAADYFDIVLNIETLLR